jgi:hypothetical protein
MLGFKAAERVHVAVLNFSRRPTMNAKQLNKLITQIAQQYLMVETLETRHSDALDFHEVTVWQIESALRAAFEAGRQDALNNSNT